MRNLFVLSIAAMVCFGCNAVLAETLTPPGSQVAPASAQVSSGTAPTSAPAVETVTIDLPGLPEGARPLVMVLIRPGSFSMGSEKADNERPVHKVTISKPFHIGAYEVTQAQWEAVMGSNPSKFKGVDNPVETVSWNDCLEFIKKLNEKVPGGGFRLPTEAEWEYVCRAGGTTGFCYGDNEMSLGEYAWWRANSGDTTHPVGQKKPNAWGVYDMHGNVWEWCLDLGHDSYSGDAPTDGSAWEVGGGGTHRILRGGSWNRASRPCQSSFRLGNLPDRSNDTYGFRLSRTP